MKKWFKIYIYIFIVVLISIVLFNFFMDPFWTFNHSHKFNSIQKGTNERQQKANYIYFTDKKFDTLLLGSSRTTYMNRHSFSDMEVFNFSASGMRPHEYLTYADFVISEVKQPIKNIIIGMDFFGYLSYGLYMFDDAKNIVNSVKQPFYRYKMLLSFDALNNSFKNLRDYTKNRHSDRYNRDVVKIRDFTETSEEQIKKDVLIYARTEYNSKPNRQYEDILQKFYSKYSDKKIIVYTTPISEPLFSQLIKMGHYENYENWLKTLVNIFGEVHHFMYKNIVSKNYVEYFADSNHAYTKTNHILAQTIVSNYDNKLDDFGVLLNSNNLKENLMNLRKLNGID